jgi:glyoxylase-like metal-dependent hydrolase (beta-lactamase superfamily II)
MVTVVASEPSAQPASASRVVRLRTLSPGDIIYVLLGGGGNAIGLMRDEGAVLIDTKSPGWGRAVLDAVEAASEKPVATIINTHAHLDHTGGNPELPTATRIIAHANAARRMRAMPEFQGPNARYLPNEIVSDRLSLLDGRDRINLYYFGRGHTDGDLVVVFPEKRLAYFGDLFPSKAAPVIDVASGGSGIAFPETLAKAVAAISGVARVVTGHEEGLSAERNRSATSVDISTPRTMTWADLQEYADFNRDFLAAVRDARSSGKAADEAIASLRLPERYKDYDMRQAAANVRSIYAELAP